MMKISNFLWINMTLEDIEILLVRNSLILCI